MKITEINEAFKYDLITLQNGAKELRENLFLIEQLAATVECRKEAYKRKNPHITNEASIDRMFREEIWEFARKAKSGYNDLSVGFASVGAQMFELDIDEYTRNCIENTPQRKL
jgi:hypothetical protein